MTAQVDRRRALNLPKRIVGPRLMVSARAAGIHLPIKLGTNLTLMNELLHEIIANDWIDHEYLDALVLGCQKLAAMVEAYLLERTAEFVHEKSAKAPETVDSCPKDTLVFRAKKSDPKSTNSTTVRDVAVRFAPIAVVIPDTLDGA